MSASFAAVSQRENCSRNWLWCPPLLQNLSNAISQTSVCFAGDRAPIRRKLYCIPPLSARRYSAARCNDVGQSVLTVSPRWSVHTACILRMLLVASAAAYWIFSSLFSSSMYSLTNATILPSQFSAESMPRRSLHLTRKLCGELLTPHWLRWVVASVAVHFKKTEWCCWFGTAQICDPRFCHLLLHNRYGYYKIRVHLEDVTSGTNLAVKYVGRDWSQRVNTLKNVATSRFSLACVT